MRSTSNLSDLRIYLWVLVLHVLLLYPLIGILAQTHEPLERRLIVLFLVVAFALSHWLVMFRQREWQSRVDRMVPFLLLNLVLVAVLVVLASSYWFLFLFIAGYAFRFLPLRWAVVVGVLTALVALSEHIIPALQAPTPENVLQAAARAAWSVSGILVVAWIAQFARQSRERQILLERLQATQGELASAERQAGILEERARMSREIHDTLAQGLVGIIMHLEAAEESSPKDASTTLQHVDQAQRMAREDLAEARRFVWALQPQALERDALPQAIARVAENWSNENQIPVALSTTGNSCQLPPEFEVTLLRAAQEALVNIAKHARAHHVNLTLSYMNDQVVLDVNDDGIGFDPDQIEPDRSANGFGLAGMRQRVERLGGHMSVESSPGEGTTLVVEAPIMRGEKS